MMLVEKIFELRKLPLFEDMPLGELAKVAEVARDREYRPGQLVHSAGKPVQRLYLVVRGGLVSESGTELPRTIGVESLLFDVPLAEGVIADQQEGATCLVVSKGHFFTTVYEGSGVAARLLRRDDDLATGRG
jgi:CRP-like cAMP-binding protein